MYIDFYLYTMVFKLRFHNIINCFIISNFSVNEHFAGLCKTKQLKSRTKAVNNFYEGQFIVFQVVTTFLWSTDSNILNR